MKRTFLVSLALVGACLAPTLGSAQSSADHGAMLLQMWDANGDSTVTLAEVQTRRGDIFTAFDTNGDDTLTPDEMATLDEMRALQQEEMGAGEAGQEIGQVDAPAHGKGMGQNGGTIDRASFVAKAEAWLARKDKDGDGQLTAADFNT